MGFFKWMIPAVIGLSLYKAHRNTKQAVVNYVSPNRTCRGKGGPYLKVLHLSDLHLEKISVSPGRLYDLLKDESIDLIALTGDFLDRKKTIPRLVPYLKQLRRLQPKYGMFAVFGNHDYVLDRDSFAKLQQTLEQAGVTTLRNENRRLDVDGHPLHIIGIDDYSTGRSRLLQSFRNVKDGFRLILTHDPNLVLEMKQHPFDYLLSGHFHGGQICWPKPYHMAKTMGKLVRMNMLKGLHHVDGKPFYINEGLGQSAVNLRIGSRPEITIHSFRLKAMEAETYEAAAT
ncbi:MAG TPA: metallophosphoesterase [Bacillales bacterium]|nr:metallophosphoesterase [Bacillales bacterium]